MSIFGRIGVRKYERNHLALLIVPAISPHTIVGLNGGFIQWDNSSNLLKARCILPIRYWRVKLNG